MRRAATLYPRIEPFDRRMLRVGDGHEIYVEQCGRRDGPAVVVLHGGPGGGCSPAMRRFFDPHRWRVVLFDQRGCGKSRPHASVEGNTTWDLVADIEHIRDILGIDEWVVFGGSWGATLALIYAQTHPGVVKHLVLRGVFLATRAELDWFYGGGAGRFWPEQWQKLLALLPADEHDDVIAAYHKRLFGGDEAEEIRFAQAWTGWENALAMVDGGYAGSAPPQYARAFARLEAHYFHNAAFLDSDDHIIAHMDRIAHIGGTIVQGRMDMICPPVSAWRLAQAWPRSDLVMVPGAGHALSDPAISRGLVTAMETLSR